MDQSCYWDSDTQSMKLHNLTPTEQAELDARRAAGPSAAEHNAPILAALLDIDARSIRALREGDSARIASLEVEAAALRLQLRK